MEFVKLECVTRGEKNHSKLMLEIPAKEKLCEGQTQSLCYIQEVSKTHHENQVQTTTAL